MSSRFGVLEVEDDDIGNGNLDNSAFHLDQERQAANRESCCAGGKAWIIELHSRGIVPRSVWSTESNMPCVEICICMIRIIILCPYIHASAELMKVHVKLQSLPAHQIIDTDYSYSYSYSPALGDKEGIKDGKLCQSTTRC
jgi:hypothetical protein